jgi:hypothetical protein
MRTLIKIHLEAVSGMLSFVGRKNSREVAIS